MKRILVLLILTAMSAFADPGTVVRTSVTTITSTAPTGANTLVCVFTNPNMPVLHAVCSVNGVVRLTQDVNVQVGAQIGSVGSYSEGGNTITWQFTQPTANNFAYDVAANGTHDAGNF